MKKITKKDLINFLEKNNFHTKKNVKITKNMASNWSLFDLGCFVALSSYQFGRSLQASIKNAETWMDDGKQAILNTFFKKDIEATF